MKKNLLHTCFLPLFVIFFSGNLFAQFKIGGEFKMRGEFRDGYQSLRDSSKTPYATILGRARLSFDYNTEKISTRFSLNDAWVFGQNYYSSDTITKNTVNIFEAWFQYNFTKAFSLKVGRTEVVYDDERLFGLSNWSMWGATHDIVIAQIGQKEKGCWENLGFAVNNIAPASAYLNSYNMRNNYKYLGYLYGNIKVFDKKLTLSYLGIIDAFQKYSITTTKIKTIYDTLYIYNQNDSIIGTTILPVTTKTSSTEDFVNTLYGRGTIGGTAGLELKKWSFFLNGFCQFGHIRDGRKLSSYFYTAWVSFQPIKKLKLMVGWEQLSGNNFSDTSGMKLKVKGFSTLYGTSHRSYGYMDLFGSIVKDNMSPGLNDLYGRATLSFTDKMSLEATYRWFSIPYGYLGVTSLKKGELPYKEVKTDLGSEIDLMYVYKPIPNLELNAAYCFFLPTSTMETLNKIEVGKSKFAQFAYVMITYKPNFFNSEKH
ncbi:MAG: alginate export family protein [Bacteroidales bacterium]|nr:alginate export family protein [Bacteroidales bacterium]